MTLLFALLATLAAFAAVGLVISFFVTVVSFVKPRKVWVWKDHHRKVRVTDDEYKDEIAKALKDRRRTARNAAITFTVSAAYLAVYFFGGIFDMTYASQHESAVASATEEAEAALINPPTDEEEILSLTKDGLTTDIVLPDGTLVEATIAHRSYGFFDRSTGRYEPVGAESTELLKPLLNESGYFSLDAEQQRQWLVYGEVYSGLEDTYGVFLDDAQRTALAAPLEEPEHLTRYGSTPLTTSLGDGTYFNGTVTLIWDEGYKLIGSEGTDQAAELARK